MRSEKQKHSKYSPSSCHRWIRCPASINLQEEKVSSKAAEEGIKAHELANNLLKEGVIDSISEENKEMLSHVESYIEYISTQLSELALMDYKCDVMSEVQLDISNVIKDTKGTADCIIVSKYNEIPMRLDIIDFKYGAGIKVSAHRNEQLMMYAIGAMNSLDIHHIDEIVLHIFQPRKDNIDVYIASNHELEAFKIQLIEQYAICESDNPPFLPSEIACRFCDFKPKCKALLELTEETLGVEFKNLSPAKIDLAPEQISKILDNKSLIQNYLKAVEEHAVVEAMLGESYPGYELYETAGRRRYKEGAEQELLMIYGDEICEKRLAPITVLEKKVGKKEFEELGVTEIVGGKIALKRKID